MTNITNDDDYIDMRDVTDRVEELRNEAAFWTETTPPTSGVTGDDVSELAQELATLAKLLDDTRGNGGDHDWEGDWYPGSLIRYSYFAQAMDELLEDCGDLPRDLPSYLKITVDYDALQMDYTSVEFEGVTYWYR